MPKPIHTNGLPINLLILEGADGTGKTSYAKWLEAQGWVYRHFDKPSADTWQDEYVVPLEDDLAVGRDIVYDRSYVGELVWPAIFNRKPVFGNKRLPFDLEFRLCESIYGHSVNVLYWFVFRDEDSITETLARRGESDEEIEAALLSQHMFGDLTTRNHRYNIVESDALHRALAGAN